MNKFHVLFTVGIMNMMPKLTNLKSICGIRWVENNVYCIDCGVGPYYSRVPGVDAPNLYNTLYAYQGITGLEKDIAGP